MVNDQDRGMQMAPWAKAGIAKFVGSILAAVFIAACAAAGYGPDWVVAYLVRGTWISPELARAGLLVLGISTAIYMFGPAIRSVSARACARAIGLRENVRNRLKKPPPPPEVRLALLWRAQRLLLEIESLDASREFDVHINLTEADVPEENQARYPAVWLGNQGMQRRTIPKGIQDWVEVFEYDSGDQEARRHFYFVHHDGGRVCRTRTNQSMHRLNQSHRTSVVKVDISGHPQFRDGPKTIVFGIASARSVEHISGDFDIRKQ